MAVEIVMPRVDMDMTSGRMGRWHAAEGAHVVKGATLFEIETDKAAMEVDAPASGVLKFVAASEGDVLPVGACIGWIVAEGENFVAGRSSHAPTSVAAAVGGRSVRAAPSERRRLRSRVASRPRATPAARRMARERGLRLESVKGSGPAGAFSGATSRPRRALCDAVASCDAAVHRVWLQRGEGAPIVFLHGFGADLNGWRPVHRLLPETRPALAIDLPGHGLSPLGEEASFEALVEAARAALIGEGVSAAHLIGHSLGGAVAVALSRGQA